MSRSQIRNSVTSRRCKQETLANESLAVKTMNLMKMRSFITMGAQDGRRARIALTLIILLSAVSIEFVSLHKASTSSTSASTTSNDARRELRDSAQIANEPHHSVKVATSAARINTDESDTDANREKVSPRFGYITPGRWNKESETSDNEIDNVRPQHKPVSRDYACGRAIASRRYKELLMRDQSYSSVSRPKYRPIEIRMPRIIGGDETLPGEFPWAVSVKLNGQPICGGSLIDKSWILTAGHCVVGYNPKNLTVRLGAYRIKDMSETQTVDLPVSLFVVHKDYSMPRPFSNDIALLKTVDPIEYSDYIIPICLPIEDQVSTSTSNALVTDYGNTRYETGRDMIDDTTSGGIVVSTKMSDADIASCFNKLERNYLKSIGISDSTNNEHSKPQSTISLAPVALSPVTSSPVHQSQKYHQNAQHQSGNQYHYNHPLFSLGGSLLHNLAHLREPSSTASQNVGSIVPVASTNHLSSLGASNLGVSNAHSTDSASITLASQHRAPVNQDFESPSLSAVETNNNHKLASATSTNTFNNYEFATVSNNQHNSLQSGQWTWRTANNAQVKRGDSSHELRDKAQEARANPIRFSRLPISEDLLREIQSVGSGPMPSLNFELQKDGIAAMANDLTGTQVIGGNNANIRFSADDGGSSSEGNRRERYRENPANNNRQNMLKLSGEDESMMSMHNDDPTRYSGLSGTVVGWGWLREQDDDDPANKGYPSVTLQKVKLPILRNRVCEAWFQSQSKKITLLPSQFCAGYSGGGKDACRVCIRRCGYLSLYLLYTY